MTLRPPRHPKTLLHVHFERASKTMVVDGFAVMQDGAFLPGYEQYLKNALGDIQAMYRRFREESDRIDELGKDPARVEEASRARRRHSEIVDILFHAEEIIWDRLSLIGVKKA